MDCNGLYRFRLRFNSDCHGEGPANEPCLHIIFFQVKANHIQISTVSNGCERDLIPSPHAKFGKLKFCKDAQAGGCCEGDKLLP